MNASTARGFAGLSTLVSDVTADVAEAERLREVRGSAVAPMAAHTPAAPINRAPRAGMSPGTKWLLGIGIAIAAVWLIGLLSNQSTTPQNEVPVTSSPPAADTPASVPATPVVPAPPAAPVAPAAPPMVDLSEKPPVGKDLVLDIGQIRYCLAEQIRISTIRLMVNNQGAQDVDRFNARVDDYNSRCSAFQYESGTLEQARAEVDALRDTIENEARAQWESGK